MIAAPFEKTYLSRAQSRIWSMDNPVGDPFGGPAYGEKEEPVSMIAAVVAIGVGTSTAMAVGATALTMVMGGLMIAGGAASLIGTVSGNKKLAMIGGIVAGVGGLGLGAANMFADAAATTTLSSTSGDALASGMSNSGAAAGGAAPYGTGVEAAYANPANLTPTAGGVDASQIVNMPSVGNPVSPTAMPSLNGAESAAGGAAPYGTGTAANYSNPGLINSVAGNSIGSAADLGGTVVPTATSINPVDDITNQLTTEFTNVAGNPLQPSPYESLADASGNTPLVPKPGSDLTNYANDPNYIEALTGTPPATPEGAAHINLAGNGDYGVTTKTGQVLDSSGNYMGQAPGFEVSSKPTVVASRNAVSGGESTNWLDKIEGIANGIEKYKKTTDIAGNLISGAMKYAVPSQSDQAAIELYQAKANLANQEASAIAALEDRKRRQNEAVKNLKPIQLNNASNPIFGNALNGAGIINSARA